MRLFPRIAHLPGSRATADDDHAAGALAARCTGPGRAGDRVLVTEKLDGTCVAICREGGEIVARGRDGRPCAASANDGRRWFAAWVAAQPARWAPLVEGERLIVEWLVLAHGTRYALPHEPAVVIDRHRDGWRSWSEVVAGAAAVELPVAAVLHDGGACPLELALAALGGHGHHGALDPAEGLVYRVERTDGQPPTRAKYARAGLTPGVYLADHSGAAPVWNAWRGPWPAGLPRPPTAG